MVKKRYGLPVDNMSDTVEEKNIGEENLSTIDPSTSILSNSKSQISALKTRNADVGEISREEHIVDNVILQHLLQSLEISVLED
jgi:hypothetical protein